MSEIRKIKINMNEIATIGWNPRTDKQMIEIAKIIAEQQDIQLRKNLRGEPNNVVEIKIKNKIFPIKYQDQVFTVQIDRIENFTTSDEFYVSVSLIFPDSTNDSFTVKMNMNSIVEAGVEKAYSNMISEISNQSTKKMKYWCEEQRKKKMKDEFIFKLKNIEITESIFALEEL